MQPATHQDQEAIVNIIIDAFDANPSVNMVIGEGGKRGLKIRRLAEYTFVKCWQNGGAFLSKNGKGTALIYRSDALSFNWLTQWNELKFALSLTPKQIFKVLKREQYLKEHRDPSPHYYFWFFGVSKGGDRAAFELKDQIFEMATRDQLPILLETSVWRNVIIYQRYGFHIYHTWEDEQNRLTLWFMKKDVHS